MSDQKEEIKDAIEAMDEDGSGPETASQSQNEEDQVNDDDTEAGKGIIDEDNDNIAQLPSVLMQSMGLMSFRNPGSPTQFLEGFSYRVNVR